MMSIMKPFVSLSVCLQTFLVLQSNYNDYFISSLTLFVLRTHFKAGIYYCNSRRYFSPDLNNFKVLCVFLNLSNILILLCLF